MSIIVSICQHFGEQQFRNTVMCSYAPYTIFSVAKLDLCIRALTRSHYCSENSTRTPRVHLVLTYQPLPGHGYK